MEVLPSVAGGQGTARQARRRGVRRRGRSGRSCRWRLRWRHQEGGTDFRPALAPARGGALRDGQCLHLAEAPSGRSTHSFSRRTPGAPSIPAMVLRHPVPPTGFVRLVARELGVDLARAVRRAQAHHARMCRTGQGGAGLWRALRDKCGVGAGGLALLPGCRWISASSARSSPDRSRASRRFPARTLRATGVMILMSPVNRRRADITDLEALRRPLQQGAETRRPASSSPCLASPRLRGGTNSTTDLLPAGRDRREPRLQEVISPHRFRCRHPQRVWSCRRSATRDRKGVIEIARETGEPAARAREAARSG